jgi:mycoredoxin
MLKNKLITMYGTRWCGDSKRARNILDDNKIDYIFIDIDQDKDGEKYVVAINHGNRSVPTIVFPDGSVLTEPGSFELIDKLKAMGEI